MLKLPTDLIHLCNRAWPRGCDDCALTCSRHGKVLEQRQEIYRTVWLPRLLKIHRPFGEGIETPRRARLQQDFPFAQRRCGGVHVALEDDVEEVQRPLYDDARPDPGRTHIGMSTDAKYHREQDNARARAHQWREADQHTDRWSDHGWQDDRHAWNRPTPSGRSRSPPARTQHRSKSRVPPSPHPTDCEDDPTEDDDEYVQEVLQQQQCKRDDAFCPRRRPDGRRPVFKPRGHASAEAGNASAAAGEAAEAAPKWQQMPRISILGINLGGRRRRTDFREFICNSAMHICLCLELIQATDAEFFEDHGIGFVAESGCSVLWRKTVFALESYQERSSKDTDGQWGVAAVAARLTPNLDCGHLGPLTLGAAHVRNTLAKRPVAVMPHLEALEMFFQSAEADIGYIDANQSAFAREHEASPIDATFATLKGWLKSPTHSSLLARCPMDTKRGQCT
eukprot:505024-Amphidinium_carterae.1